MTTFQGQVLSTKNVQTATVVVRRRARHPLYGKSITKTKKYHVHDPFGVNVGDRVEFTPCRPVSKTKRWVITKVNGKKPVTAKTQNKEKATPKTKAKKTKAK